MSKQVILTIPDSVDLSALREMKLILRYYKDGNDLYEYLTDSFSLSEAKGDLISREALKEAIKEEQAEGFVYVASAFDKVYELIDNAPTVDIWKIRQEGAENGFKKAEHLYKRPKGEWINQSSTCGFINHGKACSLCGKVVEFSENFCPACGARMDMRGDNK